MGCPTDFLFFFLFFFDHSAQILAQRNPLSINSNSEQRY